MASEDRIAAQPFRKGDRVIEKLRGAGYTTEEPKVVAFVRKGIAYVDNGPGNAETGYDAVTGKYALGDDFGFVRRIERAES